MRNARTFLANVAVSAAVAGLGGCAACRPYQVVRIASEPPNSTVFLDGEAIGQTPLVRRIDRSIDHSVYLKRDGYTPKLVVLELQRAEDGIDWFLPPDVHVTLRRPRGGLDREVQIELEADPKSREAPDTAP